MSTNYPERTKLKSQYVKYPEFYSGGTRFGDGGLFIVKVLKVIGLMLFC